MSNFLRAKRLLFLLLTVFTILSCSGENNQNKKQLTGRTAAGDALVWLDLNANLTHDPDEPMSRTTLTGSYSLQLPRDLSISGLAIVVGVEAGTSKTSDNRVSPTSYLLVAPASASDVSVWTTLVTALVLSEEATDQADGQAKVRAAFELSDNFDFSLEMTNKEQSLTGLTQLVENAYGQKSAEVTLRHATEPKMALIAAAQEIVGLSRQLLDIVNSRFNLTAPPPLTGSRPLETGVFYGDFTSIPINTDMAYGIGLDAANYNLKGVCIDTTTLQFFDGLCSNDYSYTFDLVESVDELSKKLQIGAAAKAGVSVAGFDVVSVSGGFDFLRATEFKNDALYILFRVEQKLCGYPAVLVLKPEWAEKFSNNYEEFRSTCGDRYLSSITSGGAFSGLVKVLVAKDTKIEDLRLSLSGKVLGSTVYKKTWKETLSDIEKDYVGTTTRVLSNSFSTNCATVAEVFNLYDAFAAKMKTPECSTATGWKDCGYFATFSTYETISNTPPANAATVRTNLANMRALESYYFESADLLSDINDILLYPDDYNIGDSVDAFSNKNDWTLDKIKDQQDQINDYQLLATGQWSICKTNIQKCNKNMETLALPSWLELKQALPTHKFIFPESCTILAAQFGVTDDGEHWLFFGGNVSKSYRVYCQDMATSEPKTYLKLVNSSANVTAPSYNHSSLHYETNDGNKGMITRTFEGLLVEPRKDIISGDPYLRILAGQNDYTAWAASPVLVGDSQALLAKTLDILEAQGQGGTAATANLNLEGTPFILSPAPEVKGVGAFTELLSPISSDRKNIDVTVVGGTAMVESDIRLEWDKSVLLK